MHTHTHKHHLAGAGPRDAGPTLALYSPLWVVASFPRQRAEQKLDPEPQFHFCSSVFFSVQEGGLLAPLHLSAHFPSHTHHLRWPKRSHTWEWIISFFINIARQRGRPEGALRDCEGLRGWGTGNRLDPQVSPI